MASAPRAADDKRSLRLGVAGLGRAFTLMLPTFVAHPRVQLVAAADPRPEARARFAANKAAVLQANHKKPSDHRALPKNLHLPRPPPHPLRTTTRFHFDPITSRIGEVICRF